MKKNYSLCALFFAFFLTANLTFSQTNLSQNEFGPIIQNWLDQKKDNYGLTENDIQDLQVSNAFFSESTRINHVYLNQAYQGIKIYNAISSVAVRDNSVFYFANSFIADIASKINTTQPTISAEQAI